MIQAKRLGDINGGSLFSILWALHLQRHSGRLHARRDDLHKTLWLRDGSLVFASSNQVEDRLIERLRLRGLLSPEEYTQIQQSYTEAGGQRRIGELLLDARLIRRLTLEEALAEHLLRVVDTILGWHTGTWAFDPNDQCDEQFTLKVPLGSVLMTAARDRLDLKRMRAELDAAGTSWQLQLPRKTDHADVTVEFGLHPSEQALLPLLLQTQTLAGHLKDFRVDERELTGLCFVLWRTGYLVPTSA